MRIGLVGYGAWGRTHASTIARLEGLELVGIVCGGEASARQAAGDWPDVPIYHTLDALLADPTVELVDIVVPTHLHAAMALNALAAGKHVQLEKPMAITLADAQRLIETAERMGLYLGIGLELRVSRQWAKVRDLIAEGALGTMRFANLALFRRPFRGGSGNWRRTGPMVGSWILEEGIHYIDLLLWYFRERGLPVGLSASGVPSPLVAGMYDVFTATLTFADGSYAVFTQCLTGFEHSLVLELAGDQGAIRTSWAAALDRTTVADFQLKVRRSGAEAPETVAIEKSGELFELEEELRRLPQGVAESTPLVSAREALPSLRVCLAIEQSLVERRPLVLTGW